MMAGVANGRAHAGGELSGHTGEFGLGFIVPVLVEVLETEILDIVAAVGTEAVDGKRVAHLADRIGQQHTGAPGQIEHGILLAMDDFVGGLGQVEQHQDREIAGFPDRPHHDARVRLIAHADVDETLDGGVDVDLVAVFQLADALHALRLHGIEQELHAVDFAFVLGGDVVDQLHLALLGALFQHGRPGRTFELDLVIPFRVMERVGDGLLAFQFVETLAVALVADVFVGKQFGAQYPDFLGVVAGGFDVDLVGHLHDADVLAHLLDAFVAGAGGLVEIELFEFPEVAVVVPVRRVEQIGARIEGDPLFAQAMRQLDADFPGRVVAVQSVLRIGEQYARLGDPRIVVLIGFVEQCAGEAVQVIANAGVHLRCGDVQPGPHRLEAGEAPDRQGFDAGVFDHGNHRHLHRVERLGRDRLPGFDDVRGAVRGGGAVEFQAGNRLAVLGLEIIECIRHMQQVIGDIRPIALATFEVAGGRAHEEVACPKRAQIHVDAPLHVNQQRALALLLHHRQRFLRIQAEVLDLLLVIGAMRVCAPQRPAAQAAQRQVLEQHFQLVQHRPHAARRLRDQRVEELQVLQEQRSVTQPVGGGGGGSEQ